MTTFISHSFQNKPEFENIVDALEQRSIPYWNPSEVRAGASLREQLRNAVEKCTVCIFVATRDSIDSSWCGAELGAFWGAGKSIIVYLAEPSLKDAELPPIVQSDVYERRISRVVERAKEVIEQAGTPEIGKFDPMTRSISQLTVEQFEKLLVGAVSLAAASAKEDSTPASFQSVEDGAKLVAGSVLSGFRSTAAVARTDDNAWVRKVLWVDDRPENNVYERQSMESMGLEFTLALSTDDALEQLSRQRFAVIISDMGRKEGPREGYVLLEALRKTDARTPFFIYASSSAPEHRREAASRGAQGTTNRARELVDWVVRALPTET